MPSSPPLSRLLKVLQPSLAMYLADSGIWSYPGKESIKLALADLVSDHRSMVDRAAAVLDDRGMAVTPFGYPIGFTGCHDTDMRSLLPRVVAGLRGQMSAIDSIIESAGDDPVAAELAREAKFTSQNHLDALEQIANTC
ncbi:MAG: hypothetical protein WCQ77_11045 [Planctomycetota bacterium]